MVGNILVLDSDISKYPLRDLPLLSYYYPVSLFTFNYKWCFNSEIHLDMIKQKNNASTIAFPFYPTTSWFHINDINSISQNHNVSIISNKNIDENSKYDIRFYKHVFSRSTSQYFGLLLFDDGCHINPDCDRELCDDFPAWNVGNVVRNYEMMFREVKTKLLNEKAIPFILPDSENLLAQLMALFLFWLDGMQFSTIEQMLYNMFENPCHPMWKFCSIFFDYPREDINKINRDTLESLQVFLPLFFEITRESAKKIVTKLYKTIIFHDDELLHILLRRKALRKKAQFNSIIEKVRNYRDSKLEIAFGTLI